MSITPSSLPLDETITPGQLGHIADHEAIAIALNNQVVNAAAFGATGDGSDQTTELQDALNAAAPSTGPARLYIPAGHYRFDQLTMPRGVSVIGAGWGGRGTIYGGTYAGNHNATMLEQNSGVNDDAIVFERDTDFDSEAYQYIGPTVIRDLILQGSASASAGSGIKLESRGPTKEALANSGLWLERLAVQGFAEDGIEFPLGCVPGFFSQVNAYFNSRYGISVTRDATLGNVQALGFHRIEGDSNSEGLIYLFGLKASDSVGFDNIKSEMRSNPFRTGVNMQENVIVLEDCQDTAIHVRDLTHVSSELDGAGPAYLAPGPAIKVISSAPGKVPKITWDGVAVRIHDGSETGGPGPVLDDADDGTTVVNGTASGGYGYRYTVGYAAANNGFQSYFVFGDDGAWAGPASLAGPGILAKGETPVHAWWETDGAADQKSALAVLSAGEWSLRFYNDAGTIIDKPIAVTPAAGPVTIARQLTLAAGTTARASLNIPHGVAPTTPVNGDMWTTTAGLFVRINGVTVGPLT